MPDQENLKNHVAHEVMSNVEELAQRAGISKKAAYYIFLGYMPKDVSAFSKREIEMIKAASAKPTVGRKKG